MVHFIKFLGKNNRNSFLFKRLKTITGLDPDVNPWPKFAGYVNFILTEISNF